MPADHWTSLFIGRQAEIDWLKEAWSEVKVGKPRFCVLRGESGFGKTKIVQAFYSWLSSDPKEDPDEYWPDVLLTEQNNLRLNPPPASFRKVNKLPWLWWGIRWGNPEDNNLNESSFSAILGALEHLAPHCDVLLGRAKARARAKNFFTEFAVSIAEAASIGYISAAKTIFELGHLLKQEHEITKHESLSLEDRQARSVEQQLENVFDFFHYLLSPHVLDETELPVILVLDDAQWVDPHSLEFVRRLYTTAVQKSWPLLIIATHWEREWHLLQNQTPPASVPGLLTSFMQSGVLTEHPNCIVVRDIGKLDGLESLLRVAFPGLTSAQTIFLRDQADGNPRLMNEIILELSGEPFYFEEENFNFPLTVEALQDFRHKSFELHKVQSRRFRRLDIKMRKLLTYASYQGMYFLKDLAIEVSQIIDVPDVLDNKVLLLEQAIRPHALIESDNNILCAFRHRVFYDLARERVDMLPTLQKSLSDALMEVSAKWLKTDRVLTLPGLEREFFCVLLLSQFALSPQLRFHVLAILVCLYAENGFFARARPFAEHLENSLPDDGGISIELVSTFNQVIIIELFLSLGRWHAAERLARALNQNLLLDIADHGETAERLHELSIAQQSVGDVLRALDRTQEALELYRSSLATYEHNLKDFGKNEALILDMSVSQERVAEILFENKPQEALALYRTSLAARERNLVEFGETAHRLSGVAISQDNVGCILFTLGQPQKALILYRTVLATHERILGEFGETVSRLRNVSRSQDHVADALLALSKPQEALILFRSALATHERILGEFGEAESRLRDVSASQFRVGDVLFSLKQWQEALALYRAALTICERILVEFGETALRLSYVSWAQDRLADVLRALDQPQEALALYRTSLATRQRILVEFDETAQRLRDVSVSQNNIGDVLFGLGQPQEALVLYRASLETNERILHEFGEIPERLRDVSVSQNNVGKALFALNHSKEALTLHRAAVTGHERLLREFGVNAERLSDVTVSQSYIGDVLLGLGQSQEAIALYRASLETNERILRDFGETESGFRAVSVLQERIGDALRENQPQEALTLYRASLLIRERILSQFGENSERLRDVSAAQIRVGDILFGFGQPKEALVVYRAALETEERILRNFGGTESGFRAVPVLQERIGDVLRESQPQQALSLYRTSLVIRERILSEFGENPGRLRDVSAAQIKVGDILFELGHPQEALVLYRASLETDERILRDFGETVSRLRDLSISQERVSDALSALYQSSGRF